ncbi:sugar isomerase domain-containing protein [Jiangella ureilytica]|uniref:sugar isomerase domain-containing protein n=1 Tax=Jiangella ureilytica TaxID=2530374 RepID=UPI00193D2CBD|nr:SIS domain-containing protein [Jiangella ureilytica]
MTTTDLEPIGQPAAARILREAADRLIATQAGAISAAARLVADGLRAGGLIQAFATGHSRSITAEIVGRAGGLVPANALSIKDLVMYGGADPREILDPTVERDPSLAQRILDLAEIHPSDVFVITSNSGGNGSVVEMARLAKAGGHPLIAITSAEHSSQITSRHPSGQRLFELADVVIDNGSPRGDAALALPSGVRITPTSSLTGVLIAQLLVTEVCGLLLASGEDVPVLVSANVPEGDAHNEALFARYGTRLRPSEP